VIDVLSNLAMQAAIFNSSALATGIVVLAGYLLGRRLLRW